MKVYKCPICKKGNITIETQRTGPTGFRDTDIDIVDTTCDCITYKCEATAMAIIHTNDVKSKVCEDCGCKNPMIHYPVRSWVGEWKDICVECFKKEMQELEEKYGSR